MCHCECTDIDDDGGTGTRTCTQCYSSKAWTASFAGPPEKPDDRAGSGLLNFGVDHLPPTSSDAVSNCGSKVIGDDDGSSGFNSHLYVSDWWSNQLPAHDLNQIFTKIGDPYCPVVWGNVTGDNSNLPEELFSRIIERGAIWGITLQEHPAAQFQNIGRRSGGTNVYELTGDVNVYGFWAASPDSVLREDFEKELTVIYLFDRYGGSNTVHNGQRFNEVNNNQADVAPQRFGQGDGFGVNFQPLASQFIEPFGADAYVTLGFFAGALGTVGQDFTDGFGDSQNTRDLVDSTEYDRELFIELGPPGIGQISQRTFYPTGAKLGDVVPGGFTIKNKVTQTGLLAGSSGGNLDITYTHRIQIPTISFDESITGLVKSIGRCQSGKVSATVKSLNRHSNFRGGLAPRDITNPITDNAGWITAFSNACSDQWGDIYLNEGLTDDETRVHYLGAIAGISVDGEPSEESGLRFQHARWNHADGTTQTLDCFSDFADWTIPDSHTWDLGTAYVGDTMDLFFDNFGLVTVGVTNATWTGSLITAVDKTTETFLAYQRKSFDFTGPTTTLGIGATSVITITHDANGEQIPSPFTFTVRASNGVVNPPP